jgi:hypothetical protein
VVAVVAVVGTYSTGEVQQLWHACTESNGCMSPR